MIRRLGKLSDSLARGGRDGFHALSQRLLMGPASATAVPPGSCLYSSNNVERSTIRKLASRGAAGRGSPMWLTLYTPTPPVQRSPDHQIPTAMSWLYRRGPLLPRGVIQKLFRKRQVRVLQQDGVTVRRAKRDTPLKPGEMLFVPRAAVEAAQSPGREPSHNQQSPRPHPSSPSVPPPSPANRGPLLQADAAPSSQGGRQQRPSSREAGAPAGPRSREPTQAWGFRPKDSVLYADRDLVVVSKPAGLPMDGPPTGGRLTVASTFKGGLLGLRGSTQLVPAYHLPAAATGVLLLAKGEEAGEELQAALRRRKAPGTSGKERNWAYVPKEVKVMFWAAVDASTAKDDMPKVGTIVLEDNPRAHPRAAASYRVKGVKEGVMWLELRPLVGSFLHLSRMCNLELGCQILGDGHGREGDNTALQPPHKARGELLHLHARSVVVKYVRKEDEALAVTAPLPKHMASLWDSLGWDHAITNHRKPAARPFENPPVL
mmetsp:Transcript_22227/g.61681  ORF Transcript_22227/g.61681 Transcript_22227/m.61681 type:complete len:488 (+) Transcript_22227:56-1519(+)